VRIGALLRFTGEVTAVHDEDLAQLSLQATAGTDEVVRATALVHAPARRRKPNA